MEFRKSTINDMPDIMNIFKQAQSYFKENRIDQWQNNYPNENVISNDIKNNDRMNGCVHDSEVRVKRCGYHPCGSQRVLALLSFPFPGPRFYVHHFRFFLCF